MRIVQLLPTMAMGDAIGNDVLALSTVIRNMGFQTGIYAETVDRRLPEVIPTKSAIKSPMVYWTPCSLSIPIPAVPAKPPQSPVRYTLWEK